MVDAFRVTNVQTTNSFIENIFKTRRTLEDARQEISSGVKVGKASDDAGRAGTILNLQSTLQRIERHRERISFAQSLLELQENIVSQTENTLIRAKELATQGANGSMSVETRQLMADEVFELRDTLASLANTTFQGRYIYGGLDDNDPPFDRDDTYFDEPVVAPGQANPASKRNWVYDDPAVEFGQDQTREVVINDSDSVRTLSVGADVFLDGINALTRLGRSLAGYQTDLTDTDGDGDVDDPDTTGTAYDFTTNGFTLQTQDILSELDAIETSRVNQVVTELSSIGARLARLGQADEILDILSIDTENARSSIQDADVFEAASRFTNLQTSLQGLLSAGAQLNNLSLLNFI